MVSGDVTIARLRELAAQVRRYANAPGVVFGTPSTLAEICRLLGFRNDCRRGRVYLTPTKIQRLGLPLSEGDAPGFAAKGGAR